MIGMALGMLVARFTIGHPLAIWFSFLSLTLFHMYGMFLNCNLFHAFLCIVDYEENYKKKEEGILGPVYLIK